MVALLRRLLMSLLCSLIVEGFADIALAQQESADDADEVPTNSEGADATEDETDESSEEEKDEKRPPRRQAPNKRGKRSDVGPLSESPYLAMEVRDDEVARSLREQAEEACIEAEERLAGFEELLASNQGKKIDAKELGTTLIPINCIARVSGRLSLMGEPSGWDLGNRRNVLLQRLRKAIDEYRKVPGVAQQLSNTAPLVRVGRIGEAQLVKVDQLSRKGKFEAAEELMWEILDSVHSVGILYPGEVSNSILGNINAANSTAQAVFTEFRRKEALAQMEKEQKRNTPDFDRLLKELAEATQAIAAGNDPQVGSRMMSGPEWLEHFGERWQQLYFEANRCYGIDLAASTVGADGALNHCQELESEYQTFISEVLSGIAALIQADARRVSAEQASAVYTAYLQSIAKFAALGDITVIESALLPALDQLVVKSPELQADAGAYYTLSTELLRWRQRVADGYVASNQAEYENVSAAFYDAVPETDSGLPLFDTKTENELKLTTNAPLAVQAVSPRLVTKKVFAQYGLSSRGEGDRVLSYEVNCVYASIPQNVDLSLAISELKSVLLVSETHPPLTLDAALAIETATRGDLWQFGGEVTDVELEGRITKLTNAGPDDWGLFYLTSPMSRPARGYSLQHVIAHCHVRPDWLRHRYFFVELN